MVGVVRSRASLKAIEAVVQTASSQDDASGLGILLDEDGIVVLNSHDPEAALVASLKAKATGKARYAVFVEPPVERAA